jgi:hypothetical protein
MMASIVGEFEGEQATDSEDVKNRRFERILDVMQQMQELGQPPKELVGDAVSVLKFIPLNRAEKWNDIDVSCLFLFYMFYSCFAK